MHEKPVGAQCPASGCASRLGQAVGKIRVEEVLEEEKIKILSAGNSSEKLERPTRYCQAQTAAITAMCDGAHDP
jgi:hypothetical protein